MAEFEHGETYKSIAAGCCGKTFFITKAFYQFRREDKAFFYCPYCGKAWQFAAQTKEQKLEEQLKQKEIELESQRAATNRAWARSDRLERKLSATKGVVTRMKNKEKKENQYE